MRDLRQLALARFERRSRAAAAAALMRDFLRRLIIGESEEPAA